jgi:hypothetical protein
MEMSRESAELDSIAVNEERAMRRTSGPWGKNQRRDLREHGRRCGAGFQMKSTNRVRFFSARNWRARCLIEATACSIVAQRRNRPTPGC